MNKEEAFKIGLPKWTQCVINGEKITEEQALEIIRRTDSFFFGHEGNNHNFNSRAKTICKRPDFDDFKTGDFHTDWNKYQESEDEFKKEWQLVETNYIENNWISCCWIGGYHGWCHPDGTIAFRNNIGKYPEVEEVYDDLCNLGSAFPFLNLTCTLMDGEEDYCNQSLVTMKLSNGEVEFIDTIPIDELEFNGIKCNFTMGNENYFDLSQIQKWADKVYGD